MISLTRCEVLRGRTAGCPSTCLSADASASPLAGGARIFPKKVASNLRHGSKYCPPIQEHSGCGPRSYSFFVLDCTLLHPELAALAPARLGATKQFKITVIFTFY